MIAISIGRGRHRMMIAEHRHLAEMGAQLVELRLDYIVRAVNLKRLLAEKPTPVIVTCRREQDGGFWKHPEQDRLMLLRSAIAEGVDYVDLEMDVAGQIPRFGKTKRIISYHNFKETPADLREIHAQCAALNADIVKIATMANDPKDNLRVLSLSSDTEIPTVAFCMGEMGVPSRVLAGKFGAPFTYAAFHSDRAVAPGQLSYDQMRSVYRYDDINPYTEVYGVVADPIGHSMSPQIHNAAFQHLKMDRVYLPFRVPREHLDEFIGYARQFSIKGLSVTIPHKEAIVPLCTVTDQSVDHIGAANTVVLDGYDRRAFNTDAQAVLDSIDDTLGRGGDVDVLSGRTALVLGAGGVAKAVCYALRTRNVELVVTSRTLSRAEELAKKWQGRTVEWSQRDTLSPDLLINCTPLGMHPNVNESPIDLEHLNRATIVFDTVYNPEQTLLIKEARKKECRVVTGVEMFVRQAAHQFKIFTGEDPPLPLMQEVMRKSIGAAKH
ncbi:MAG: shikimate dehydrogenase [Pirellulaceae bacterium]